MGHDKIRGFQGGVLVIDEAWDGSISLEARAATLDAALKRQYERWVDEVARPALVIPHLYLIGDMIDGTAQAGTMLPTDAHESVFPNGCEEPTCYKRRVRDIPA